MVFYVLFGALILGAVILGLITRNQPTQEDRLRAADPSLKRYVDNEFWRGDGGHHREDWE
jgi:hypothetical protein